MRPFVVLVLMSACSEPVEQFDTEVLIVLEAEAPLQARWERLSVSVVGPDGEPQTFSATAAQQANFPHRVRVVPQQDGSDRPFRVDAELFGVGSCDGGTDCPIGRLQVLASGFTLGESRVIRLRFDAACERLSEESESCAMGELCVQGACESACIDPATPDEPGPTVGALCPVYVDGEHGEDVEDQCMDPNTPCRTAPFTLTNYVQYQDGRTVFFRGEGDDGAQLDYGRLRVTARDSGTAARRTVFTATPGSGRPIFSSPDLDAVQVVAESGLGPPQHILIEGLAMRGSGATGTSGAGLRLQDASDIEIRNCEFRDNGLSGIEALRAERVLIDGNLIVRAHAREDEAKANQAAITIRDSSSVEVRGNTVCGSAFWGISVIAPNDLLGIRIDHNTVTGALGEGIGIDGSASASVSITNNIVFGSGKNAIFAGSAARFDEYGFNLLFDAVEQNYGGPELPAPADRDTDIIEESPRFQNLDGCDLSLREESPAIRAASDGTNIGAF